MRLNTLAQTQAKAVKLAKSGKYFGGKAVAFELRFEEHDAEARAWLHNWTTRAELDRLCHLARHARNQGAPEVA